MNSTLMYNFAIAGYLLTLSFFIAHIFKNQEKILNYGIILLASSFLLQTSGMVLRWIEAGLLEVQAAERATQQKLSGLSYFLVFTEHPPWSNLYEILIYMSWGIILVTLICETRWHLNWLRMAGLSMALLIISLASFTDSSIKPLVPALKSWWIMIHVISASIAYASGTMAAFICFLAIIKDEQSASRRKLVAGSLLLMALLLFFLGGGFKLFLEQAYFVKLLALRGNEIVSVLDISKENGVPFYVPMPYVAQAIILSIFLHIIMAIYLLVNKKSNAYIKNVFLSCFISTILILILMLFHGFNNTKIIINSDISNHLMPVSGWFISFKSHVWGFGLLLLILMIESFILIYLLVPNKISLMLPDHKNLEHRAYQSIALSFFLMTVVLITGALWAHYAWGRYWAWDPKETGALAIWLNYAIYLHAKRTHGFSGLKTSLIGILGFFVIIIGFLGVNLGLFADGLHSYGNS